MKSECCLFFKSGIGNLIQTTPVIQALAQLDPGGKVDVCLDEHWEARDKRAKSVREILGVMPCLGEIFHYPKDERGRAYKRWFIPMMTDPAAGAKWVMTKIGQNKCPAENWPESMRHEVDANMHILRKMHGYTGQTPSKFMPVAEGPDLSAHPRPLIGLCNGAFGTQTWDKKHWPHFVRLSKILRYYYNDGTLIGVGGPEELGGCTMDMDFTGVLSILESARVIQQLDAFVSTDTSCMHIADALGVNSVALFGPTLASKNAPLNPRCRVLRSPARCAPCQFTQMFHGCGEYQCMEMITPAMVATKVRDILRPMLRYRQRSEVTENGLESTTGHARIVVAA